MALVTSQQISNYYNHYKDIDVTFTKQVIEATNLLTKQVFLKCLGEQWPCVVYSSSMTNAKVIANMKPHYFETIKKANNIVSLRLSFKQSAKGDPVSFFIASKVSGYNLYSEDNPDLNYISLVYTQRPPDDLIEILGLLLEANINSKKRKEERILLTTDTIRKLGFTSKEVQVYIEGVPRKGIMRDVSFSGAKIIVVGVAKFLMDKSVVLKLELDDKSKIINLKGKVIRFEPVESRKDLAALVVYFEEKSIPMEYKMRINDYLVHLRKNSQIHPGESNA